VKEMITLLCSDADAEPAGRLVEIASTPQEVDVNYRVPKAL
jgi:hypothetical protein